MSTMSTEERAAEIVRAARLPKGKYGLANSKSGRIDLWRDAKSAVQYAIASRTPMRLYRLTDNWLFVGIITEDGHFVDERVDHGGA